MILIDNKCQSKFGNSNLSISTAILKGKSSKALAVNASDYQLFKFFGQNVLHIFKRTQQYKGRDSDKKASGLFHFCLILIKYCTVMHNKQTSFLIFRVYYEKECKRKNVNKGKKVRIINTLINKKDILNTGKGILLKSLFDSLTL